jgi:hypothetical protein
MEEKKNSSKYEPFGCAALVLALAALWGVYNLVKVYRCDRICGDDPQCWSSCE